MADPLTTVLGFDATGALTTLNALNSVLKSYTMNMAAAATATRNYNSAAASVDKNLKSQASAVRGATAAQGQLVNQSQKSKGALRSVSTQAAASSATIDRLAKTTKKASGQMILSWKSVIRIFAIQVIHQGISKITSGLSGAAQAARKFEIGVAEVETIASGMGVSFDEIAAQAREVSMALGQPLDVVVEAQYQLFSNQVGNATESLLAFTAAQRLSIAGVTPLNDAIALITGTLNSYGESAAEADKIAAKLFKTVELGRVRISELGDSLGRVTVLGAQLGISLDEILASIATLTIQGVKASDAMTQVLNVELKLIKPTDALKDAMAELGVTSGEAGIQAFGFQGFLAKLKETTGGTATEMGELFGRVRATRGALGVTGKAAKKYEERLTAIKEATSELLDAKVSLIFETNAKQVEVELNRLSVQITENFGRGINTTLKETFDTFGGGTETLLTFGTAASAAAATFLLMRAGALKTILALFGYTTSVNLATGATVRMRTAGILATGSIKKLIIATRAFLATPVGAAVAIAVAIVAIGWAYNKVEAAAKKYFETVDEYNKRNLKNILKTSNKEHQARKDHFDKRIKNLQKFNTERVKLELDAAKKAEFLEKNVNASILEQISMRTDAIRDYADGVSGIIDGLQGKLKDLRSDSRGIKQTIDDFKITRKTKGMGDIEKFFLLIERSETKRGDARAASLRGETELSKTLSDQATNYAKQALTAADASKNRVAIHRAEQNNINILKDQLDANRRVSRQEVSRAAIAGKSADGLFAQAANLQRLTDKYKDLGTKLSDVKTTEAEQINITKERLSLAGEITDEFAKFAKRGKEAKVLGLEEPFKQAIKSFRDPITGIEMDLSDVIVFNTSRVASILQVTLDEASKQVKIEIQAITGEKTAIGGQKALTKVGEEVDEIRKRQENVINAQGVINALTVQTRLKTVAVNEALRGQEAWYVNLQRNSGKLAASFLDLWKAPTAQPRQPGPVGLDETVRGIDAQAIAIQRLITEGGDIDEINRRIEVLANSKFGLINQGFFGAANALDTLVDTLGEGRDAFALIEDNKEIDMSPVATQFNAVNTSAANATTSINDLNAAIKRVNQTEGVSAQGKSLGGMIYRQLGGYIPKGTDTIPAMLSPGEYVVNAKATRQFYSQLVAMNSGTQPVYRAEGGPVTNVGDVSIAVNGTQAPQQTAREIMSAFRRETRRGTS